MSFAERFEKWKQGEREFHNALREAVIVVARHRSPHATKEQLEEHAALVTFGMQNRHEVITDMPVVEIGVIPVVAANMKTVVGKVLEGDDRPVEWGNLFGEDSIDNTIQVSARGARLLGEYHPEGITSQLLTAKQVSTEPATVSCKIPIVDGAGNLVGNEVIYKTERVEPATVKPHRTFVPSDIHIPPEVEIKPVPSAPYERAVVASDLWRMIVDEGETGRTNAWIEQYFERLQEKYYGKVFLRIKVDGLQVGVQHLIAPDTWVKL